MKKYLFSLLASTLFACSGVKVANTSTDPNADFSKYKSFGFYKVKASGDTITESFNKRTGYLKDAISAEMTNRGYAYKENDPDLYVNIGIVVSNEVQTRETDWRTDGRYTYMGQRNYSWSSQQVEVGRYREGTVTLHVVEAANKKMIWKGSAEGVIPEKEKDMPKAVNTGMSELFKKFPVAAK
jgi:hypothetical protein